MGSIEKWYGCRESNARSGWNDRSSEGRVWHSNLDKWQGRPGCTSSERTGERSYNRNNSFVVIQQYCRLQYGPYFRRCDIHAEDTIGSRGSRCERPDTDSSRLRPHVLGTTSPGQYPY